MMRLGRNGSLPLVLASAIAAALPVAAMACFAIGVTFAVSPVHAGPNHRVTFRITYSNSVNRVRPDPQNRIVARYSLTVVLSGQRNVEESWDSRVGGDQRQSSALRVLGSDSQARGQWRVLGPNRLVR